MRVKIRIDVRKPLKRRKKICRKSGQDFVVTCKYERLGDFCFACGLVSHIERFCRRNLDNRDGERKYEWGTWLRAPPRRAAGQSTSKWLREEGDADWVGRIGRENRTAGSSGVNLGKQDNVEVVRRDFRNNFELQTVAPNLVNPNVIIGPENEELIGLNIEGRKRSRTGHETQITMDTDRALQITGFTANNNALFEANLSQGDCVARDKTNMAELAMQASQLK